MIAKAFRLTEVDVGKVLRKKKPFFSSFFVANVSANRLAHPRFAIILSGKVTKTSISRNFFRRRFFELSRPYLSSFWQDVVLVVKKWLILDSKTSDIAQFDTEISQLFARIFSSNERPTSQYTPPHTRFSPPRKSLSSK